MTPDAGSTASAPASRALRQRGMPEWTVIVPFFNERAALAATIESLAAQTFPFKLVLVDNGSTDDSVDIANAEIARLQLDATIISQPVPGKVSALAAGLAQVRTVYVATCDADTWYPADYLERATELLDCGRGTAHAAVAYFLDGDAGTFGSFARAMHRLAAARLLPFQCHSGGAGQVFRTASLRSVGGFDPDRWDYVLEDHEIIARLSALGPTQAGYRFCCLPSSRARNRPSVRWTLSERLRYHLTPRSRQRQFFEHYLGPRLAARDLCSARLRETNP